MMAITCYLQRQCELKGVTCMARLGVVLDDNKVIEKYKKLNNISKTAYSFKTSDAKIRKILMKHGYLVKIENKRLYKKVKKD